MGGVLLLVFQFGTPSIVSIWWVFLLVHLVFESWNYLRRWRKFWRPEGVRILMAVLGGLARKNITDDGILSEVSASVTRTAGVAARGCRMSWLVAFWDYSISPYNLMKDIVVLICIDPFLSVRMCDASKKESGTCMDKTHVWLAPQKLSSHCNNNTRTTRRPHKFRKWRWPTAVSSSSCSASFLVCKTSPNCVVVYIADSSTVEPNLKFVCDQFIGVSLFLNVGTLSLCLPWSWVRWEVEAKSY